MYMIVKSQENAENSLTKELYKYGCTLQVRLILQVRCVLIQIDVHYLFRDFCVILFVSIYFNGNLLDDEL